MDSSSIKQIIEQNQESDLSRSIQNLQNSSIRQQSELELQKNESQAKSIKDDINLQNSSDLKLKNNQGTKNGDLQKNEADFTNQQDINQNGYNSQFSTNNKNNKQQQNMGSDPNSHNNSNSQYMIYQQIKPNYQNQNQNKNLSPLQPSNTQALQILKPQLRPEIQEKIIQEQIEDQKELERLQKLQISQNRLQRQGNQAQYKQSSIPVEVLAEQRNQFQMRSQSQKIIKQSKVSYNAEIIFDPQPTANDMYIQLVRNKFPEKNSTQQINNLLQKYQDRVGKSFQQFSNQKSSIQNQQSNQKTQQLLQSHRKDLKTTITKQIPFVNQDKDNFFQDIVQRKIYYGNLQSESGTQKFQQQLVKLQKGPPKKKRRRHKTQFKMVKSNKNIKNIQEICLDYIQENRKMVNQEIIKLPQYEKSAPFLPSALEFADQLIEQKEQFKEKYGFEEKNLIRNKCLLETVVLSRLDQKQRQKSKLRLQKKPLSIKEIQNEEELARLLEKQNQKTFEENQMLVQQMNQEQVEQLQNQYFKLQKTLEEDQQQGIGGKIQNQYNYNKQGLKKMEEDFKQRRTQINQEFNKSRNGTQGFPKIQPNSKN